MTIIENPKIKSIQPYIKFEFDDLKKSLYANQSLYLIDNMMLTKLRKDIESNRQIIKDGFQLSKVIIIPDVILEEAARNLPDEKAFNHYYGRLFELLSTDHDIYIVNLESIFGLLKDMVGVQEDALYLLKNIISEAVRTNRTVLDSIKEIDIRSQNVLEEFRNAITHKGNNAGERFITIYSLVFLSLYFGPIFIISEDEKGIYGPYRTFLNNERLLELINIGNTTDFIKQYQFLSFESLIHSVFIKENVKKEELIDLIEKSNRNQSRRILYSLEGEPFYAEISNANLAEWIFKGIIRIKF